MRFLYIVAYCNFHFSLRADIVVIFHRIQNLKHDIIVCRVIVKPSANWKTIPHCKLPEWMQDNEFLVNGHRPVLPSVSLCLRSIFRIHTETGNIWTHLLGFLGLLIFALYCFITPLSQKTWQEQIVFG